MKVRKMAGLGAILRMKTLNFPGRYSLASQPRITSLRKLQGNRSFSEGRINVGLGEIGPRVFSQRWGGATRTAFRHLERTSWFYCYRLKNRLDSEKNSGFNQRQLFRRTARGYFCERHKLARACRRNQGRTNMMGFE